MLLSRTLIAIFLLAASSAAQTFYGSVIGTVTDQTGSSVAGAAVTLVDLARSDRRTGQTDESGNYQFVNLVPGQYRVEVEKPGFRRFVREPITVEVQSAVRIDVPMQVGDVTQTVEVTGSDAAAANRERVTRPGGRVAKGAGDAAQRPQRLRSGGAGCPASSPAASPALRRPARIRLPGATTRSAADRPTRALPIIDGAPINASYVNLTALVPTQDAIQEFRVQTNNLGPEFGRLAGGAINLTTKSGTNGFHGSAYEFFRNRSLNANTFFNNRAGVQRPAFYAESVRRECRRTRHPRTRRSSSSRWEGFRLRQGASYVYSVPTDAMRAGDFSNVRNAAAAR